MACVFSPVILRQTPLWLHRDPDVEKVQRMAASHDWQNGYDDTVRYFDLPSCLQNGPVINLERSLKADELIRTATQLRSLPLFICPISPFMSWGPQLSATLVSIVHLGAFSSIWSRWTRSCRFIVGPLPRFERKNAIRGNKMTFYVGNIWVNRYRFVWRFCWRVYCK